MVASRHNLGYNSNLGQGVYHMSSQLYTDSKRLLFESVYVVYKGSKGSRCMNIHIVQARKRMKVKIVYVQNVTICLYKTINNGYYTI